ncbi:MAG: hypothetical protein JKP92_08145 [Alphaproteobacteria bacterium]|nr:hypothetical protein [Alphaproteobacteria bacterium]
MSANDSFSPDVVVFQPRGELPHLDNFYYTVLRFIVSEQVKRGISTLEVLGALANMQHDIMIKSENGEW